MPKNAKVPLVFIPETAKYLNESFKSQIAQPMQPTLRPGMGEEHPFDYKLCEETYKNHGLAKAAVDKHLDFIFSQGLRFKSENPKAQTLVEELITDQKFLLCLREWAREAFVKGSGFMEISLDNDSVDLKVVNSNSMYIKRDKSGEIEKYYQYPDEKGMQFSAKNRIEFDTDEIAHLAIDKTGDCAYGIGIIFPSLKVLDNMSRSEKDMHVLISRKANSPIVATLGSPEEPVSASDVAIFGSQLIYLNNLHEWAVSHLVKFEALDFGNLSEKFATVLEHDKEILYKIYQIPDVVMGSANINEGIAKVQLDVFERRIQSLQELIENIIEKQIIDPYLESHGFDADVEIEWGQPSEDSINSRVQILTTLLQQQLSPELRALIEKDVGLNLGYDETDLDKIPSPEDARQESDDQNDQQMQMQQAQMQQRQGFNQKKPNPQRQKEEALTQPEIPGEKKHARIIINNESAEVEKSLKVTEYVNFQEITGFNYQDYLAAVLNRTAIYDFSDLKAETEKDYEEGLLSSDQIESLRKVLINGFTNNLSITQIEDSIKNLDFPDAENRANIIARTETVRLSNMGLVDMYKENDVKQVSFLASLSDRTCEDCLNLNGQIFNINEIYVGSNQPPIHPNCRCVLLSI